MLKAGSTIWKPIVKANCARASKTASVAHIPTSRAGRSPRYGGKPSAGSSRLAERLRPHLRQHAHADHLAQVSFNQMHDLAGHRVHGDLDVDDVTGAVGPHAVRHQV